MRATLGVPEAMMESLGAFIEAEALPFVLVAGGDCAMQVVQSAKGRESTPSVLHAGGSITCGLARDMAGRLAVKTRDLGKLLNHLDIKIRACELGCFE